MLKEWKFLDANCWSKVWESILYIIGKEGIKQPNKQTIDKEPDTEWLLKGKMTNSNLLGLHVKESYGILWAAHKVVPKSLMRWTIHFSPEEIIFPGQDFHHGRFIHIAVWHILSTFFSECNSTKQIWNSRNNCLKHKENILAFPNGISIHEILNLSSL